MERHSGRTPGVGVRFRIMGDDRICYEIIVILNSSKYVREVLQPEIVPFLQGIPGAVFQQDDARSHALKTFRDFSSVQNMRLLL